MQKKVSYIMSFLTVIPFGPSVIFLLMVLGLDQKKRDAVCLRLVNSTETRPFSSCGHTVVQCLMFKEKGGAAFSKEAFYIDATGHGVGCWSVVGCGMDEKCDIKNMHKIPAKL